MMHFTIGNLLDAKVEAVVNTVNTVGVMGKGIALMFKERFPKNYQENGLSTSRPKSIGVIPRKSNGFVRGWRH
jgi:O-acetyl-ADP-ribose deacetylase (regulator of RNase III)